MNSHPEIWILEDDPAVLFVYEELLGVRFNLRIFKRLASLPLAPTREPLAPVLLIADLRLPDGSFWSTFSDKSWRAGWSHIPILLVSSVEDVTVLQESFHLGACDFLVKPFSQAELLVKVNRCAERQLAKLRDIELDPAGHCARVEGHPSVALTAREFQITAILREAQQGLKREELTLRVWESTHVTEKALDVLLFKLRRKLRVLGWDILFNNDGRYTLSSNRMKD